MTSLRLRLWSLKKLPLKTFEIVNHLLYQKFADFNLNTTHYYYIKITLSATFSLG